MKIYNIVCFVGFNLLLQIYLMIFKKIIAQEKELLVKEKEM